MCHFHIQHNRKLKRTYTYTTFGDTQEQLCWIINVNQENSPQFILQYKKSTLSHQTPSTDSRQNVAHFSACKDLWEKGEESMLITPSELMRFWLHCSRAAFISSSQRGLCVRVCLLYTRCLCDEFFKTALIIHLWTTEACRRLERQ